VEAYLKAVLDLDPENHDVYWHLAELYFAKSIREENITLDGKRVTANDPALFIKGEKYLMQALALSPMLQLYFEAGRIYMTFGKRDEAESYFRKVLSADPHLKTRLAIMARQRLAHLRNERTP
jgi:tetratricopeptide (TPR) repeat protein